jgi:hypothetical protein
MTQSIEAGTLLVGDSLVILALIDNLTKVVKVKVIEKDERSVVFERKDNGETFTLHHKELLTLP